MPEVEDRARRGYRPSLVDPGLRPGEVSPTAIMPILSYASLADVRRSIRTRRRVRFIYRKQEVIAEPHLFGHFRKTRAFVLCAWKLEPEEGWEYFRLAEMRDFEVLPDAYGGIRPGFNPYDPKIALIDTIVPG